MKNFELKHASSFEEAASMLADGAMILAGGTDMIYSMKGMHTPNLPDTLVAISEIPDADYIKEENGYIKIGALAKLCDIAADKTVLAKAPALAQAAKLVASPELRNMGTIGGNICQRPRCVYYRNEFDNWPCARKHKGGLCYAITGVHRYHSIFGGVGGCMAVCPSDTAVALVALGASIVTTKKTWSAVDFFKVPSKEFGTARGEQINAIDSDEVVKEIQIPSSGNEKSTYVKWAFRKAIDFPQCSAAVVIKGGKANIALGGVYNEPKYFEGVDIADPKAAGESVVAKATEISNEGDGSNSFDKLDHYSNGYKIDITKTIVKRAIISLK
ncbi:MAG: FAD binding domain-containing protein [Dehalococcoidales bacterium]|nr:FAD binding domain-containing protein [Dehalococcoidales bacterium]